MHKFFTEPRLGLVRLVFSFINENKTNLRLNVSAGVRELQGNSAWEEGLDLIPKFEDRHPNPGRGHKASFKPFSDQNTSNACGNQEGEEEGQPKFQT